MNHQRPINLDLRSLRFPPMAIASILHRISGIVLFFILPFVLYLLSLSLRSSASFDDLQHLLAKPYCKVVLWAFSAALIYHILAGIRHLLMDMGVGEHLAVARRSAQVVITLGVVLAVCLGVWIW